MSCDALGIYDQSQTSPYGAWRVTHADNDHACGLIDVLKRFEIKRLWMNRPRLYAEETLWHFHGNFTLQGVIDDIKERHPYLVELEELEKSQGTQIHEVLHAINGLLPDGKPLPDVIKRD